MHHRLLLLKPNCGSVPDNVTDYHTHPPEFSAMSSLLYISSNKTSLQYTVTTKTLLQLLERNQWHATTFFFLNLVPPIPALGQNNKITLSNEPLTPSLLASSLSRMNRSDQKRKIALLPPETTHCDLLIVSLSLQEDKTNTDHDIPLSCLSPWPSEIPSTIRLP